METTNRETQAIYQEIMRIQNQINWIWHYMNSKNNVDLTFYSRLLKSSSEELHSLILKSTQNEH